MAKKENELKQELVIEFGFRIKQLRGILGKSQRGMATEIGIAPSYLSELEKGKIGPGHNFIFQLLRHYLINPRYLFLGEEPKFIGPISTEGAEVDAKILEFIHDSKDVFAFIKGMMENRVVMFDMLSYYETYKNKKEKSF